MKIFEAIAAADRRLKRERIENSRVDAEILLGAVLGRNRSWLLARLHDSLGDDRLNDYHRLIARRAGREPLQYILGYEEFRGLRFSVNRDVLIPRPETELLVEAAQKAVEAVPSPLIVDLCTGSGCIAVSLARELPQARLIATDRSEAALAVARANAASHGIANRISFLPGDLFRPLESLNFAEKADAIVSNPPYISEQDFDALQPEVRDYEPSMALLSGEGGIGIASAIITKSPDFLKTGGTLLMEMGMGQDKELRQRVEASGRYDRPDVLKDFSGIDRVIRARKIA